MASDQRARPVPGSERIEAIDIIRGFALLGVLLMNDQYFFRGPAELYLLVRRPYPGAADMATEWILQVFFSSKSVSLFSFLFGMGLAIQLERAEAKGVGFGRYALRRLGALLALGVLHIALLWMGDILHIYALLGFVLLLFLRRRPMVVLIWALAILVLPWVGMTIYTFAVPPRPDPVLIIPPRAGAWMAQSLAAYRHGSWLEAAVFRVRDYLHHTRPMMLLQFLPYAFGLFLLGLWTWRRGIVREPARHRRLLRGVLAVALPVGLGLSIASSVWRQLHGRAPSVVGALLRASADLVGTPLLALAYGAGLLLLCQRPAALRILAPLAPVGRMALTSYLAQSLVMTWIYNGHGLGLYGTVGPAAAAAICLALYAAQILVSRAWLAGHRFGPVEWLWRSVTYGELQPWGAPPRS
jgi:uncharacterized protein